MRTFRKKLIALVIACSAPGVTAPHPVATVIAVNYKQGGNQLDVAVAIPKHIDAAARNRHINWGLQVSVTYVSSAGTVEVVDSGPKSIELDTVLILIDGGTAIVSLPIPFGATPPPGGSPSYSGTAQLLPP